MWTVNIILLTFETYWIRNTSMAVAKTKIACVCNNNDNEYWYSAFQKEFAQSSSQIKKKNKQKNYRQTINEFIC